MTTRSDINEMLEELDMSLLVADGLEDAFLGYVERFGAEPVALYDRDKCLSILMEQGMTDEEALEYFEYNVIGAYAGELTPVFATFLTKENPAD